MSRSYKKIPYSGDRKDKFFKNYANRKIRRNKFHNFQYGNYRKNFQTYDICDYKFIGYTFEEWYRDAINRWMVCGYRFEPFPSREEEYKNWYRWYRMK